LSEKAYSTKWGRRTWAVLFTIIVLDLVAIAIGELSGRKDDVIGTVSKAEPPVNKTARPHIPMRIRANARPVLISLFGQETIAQFQISRPAYRSVSWAIRRLTTVVRSYKSATVRK
jgi:hypothetical protein